MTDGRLILAVDDDESIVELVRMALEDEGYDVVTAGDGAGALEILGRREPRLILLDMRMARVDGWRFAEVYRGRPGPHAPIVVITAARDAALRAAEIGADDYLGKPFDLDDLVAMVRKYVG